MKKEIKVIMCVRSEDETAPILDAVTRECQSCKSNIWVAPTSLNIMRKQALTVSFELLCMQCVLKNMETGEENYKSVPLNKEQREELKKACE